MNRLSSRAVFGAIVAATVVLLAIASYLQHVKDLEPCPLCILQRYAFFGVGIAALVGAIHGPGVAGTRVYAALIALVALAGLGTAVRHSYLQRFPDPALSCSVELDYLVNNFPLAQALPKIFSGSGDCGKVQWSMLGLSIPEWALVWFLAIVVIALWIAFRRRSA